MRIENLSSMFRRAVPPGRIVGVDLARAVALVGMMATHIFPPLSGTAATPAHQIAAGRASALFAVLAGLSLALVTGRRTPIRGSERLSRSVGLIVRSVLLYGLGVWLGERGTSIAIILPMYAAMFVAMLPFLGWRPRNLAILATAWVVIGPLLLTWIDTSGPYPDPDTLYSFRGIWIEGIYPGLVWLPYFWIGIALGRIDLSKVSTAIRLAVGGTLLAVAATIISDALLMRPHVLRVLADDVGTDSIEAVQGFLNHGLYGFVPGGSNWWLATVAPHSGTPFDLAQTIGSALAVLGVCLLISRSAPRVFSIISGAGAMSLTMYTVHVLMKSPSVWPDDVPETFPIHLAVVLGVGALFRLVGWRGPLEWVVSWVSALGTKLTRTTLRHVAAPTSD